jgi:hypothetical protein
VAGLWASCCSTETDSAGVNGDVGTDKLHSAIGDALHAELAARAADANPAETDNADADEHTIYITLLICVTELLLQHKCGTKEWLEPFTSQVVLPVVKASPALSTATCLTKVFADALAQADEARVARVAKLLIAGNVDHLVVDCVVLVVYSDGTIDR